MALTVGELVAFLRVDKGQYDRGLATARGEAHAAGRDIGQALEVEPDRNGNLFKYAQRLRDVRTLYTASLKPVRDYSTQVAGLAVKAGAASTALGGGVGLLGVVAALVFQVGQISGALPLLGTGLLGVAAVSTTLKVALSGVGDALDDKIGDALDGISPKAQRFVDEFGAIVPTLAKVKSAVQDDFFSGLDKFIGPLAERYLPLLSRNGQLIAGALSDAASVTAQGLLDPKTVTALNAVLGKVSGVLEDITPSLRGLVPLFAQLLAAGAPVLETLGERFARWLTRIKADLRAALADGSVRDAISGGVNNAEALFQTLINVAAVLYRVGQAAETAMGASSPLGAIRDITAGLRQWAASARGQEQMVAVFRAFLPVLGGVLDVLRLLGPELLSLLPVVRDLALAFLTGLAPVVPVLGDLARTLGDALTSVLPIVSKFAVLLGEFLVQALELLAPLIPPLGDALITLLSPTGLLLGVLAALKPLLVPLAQGFAQVVSILAGGLLQVVNALAPVMPELVNAFVLLAVTIAGALASALGYIAPYLPQIVDAFTQLLIALLPLVPTLVELIPYVLELVPPLVELAATVLPAVAEGLSILAGWAVQLAPHLGFLKPILEGLIVAWLLLGTQSLLAAARIAAAWLIAMGPVGWVIAAVLAVVALVILNWDKIKRATSAAWSWITTRVSGAWAEIKEGLRIMALGIANFFYALPGRIRGWIGDLGHLLWDAGARIIGGLVEGIKSKIDDVKATLGSVTRMIPGWKGPREVDAKLLTPAGHSIMGGLLAGITAEVPALRKTLADVTAMIPADAEALSLRANREATAALAARNTPPAATTSDERREPASVELGDVHVYIGDQEITDMIRVEVAASGRATAAGAYAGTGRRAG